MLKLRWTLCLLAGFLASYLGAETPRLLIKIPTYSRPDKFFKRLDIYYQRLSREVPVMFLISCDIEDQSMNNQQVINRLESYQYLSYRFSNHCSKIEAYNRDIETFDFDILLLASDDMEPIVDGYDKIIVDRMQKEFPSLDGVLNFCDGHVWAVINTVPVIGKKFYNAFGYAYCPAYKSFHCDNELSAVTRILRKECVCDEIIFDHKHPMWTHEAYDQLYVTAQKDFKNDERIYSSRRANYFGLSAEAMRAACTKDWSILISVSGEFNPNVGSLCDHLRQQIRRNNLEDKIEVICLDSSAGSTHGYRKNKLLWASHGCYISFLDERSHVGNDFVRCVYAKFMNYPDIIRIKKTLAESGDCEVIKRCIAVQFVFDRFSNYDPKWRELMFKSGLLKYQETIENPCIM